MNKYQKSECRNHYLHDYQQKVTYATGVYEQCTRCGDKQFFHWETPNAKYLAFNIRSAIQPFDSRYAREYPLSSHLIK